MRILEVYSEYDSKIYILDKEKLMTKLSCECPDFKFRKIKKINEGPDIKYYANPCKHLKLFVYELEKQGYNLKIPKEMVGLPYLTEKLKKELLDRANNMCECGCKIKLRLTIHRKMRGSNGGKYNKENCVVLTQNCHQLRHQGEFKQR